MIIYLSLPIPDFFGFRSVCKDWNAVAHMRRYFTDLVPKPYFILTQQGYQCNFTGILAYSISRNRWEWKHMTNHYKHAGVGHLYEQFVVDGVLFSASDLCHHDGYPNQADWCEYSILDKPQNLLFDVEEHKSINRFRKGRDGKRIHPPPIHSPGSILGMMVDRSRKAYKLILGNSEAGTLILDSVTNSWVARESRMVRWRDPMTSILPKSCVQVNGRMYVWFEADEIQVYNLEKDEWSALDTPPRYDGIEGCRGLAHWQGKLYAVTRNPHGTLSVWKLVDHAKWILYEQIPIALYDYLIQHDCVPPLVTAHCNEFLLISVCTSMHQHVPQTMMQKLGRRIVIFNITNKRWEIAHLPFAQIWKPRKLVDRYEHYY